MTRVVVVAENAKERALITAQVQEELSCEAASAPDFDDAIARMLVRAALIIVDLDNLTIGAEQWTRLSAAARGAPTLVIARRAAGALIDRLAIDRADVMFRPVAIGDVVARARELLREEMKHG